MNNNACPYGVEGLFNKVGSEMPSNIVLISSLREAGVKPPQKVGVLLGMREMEGAGDMVGFSDG